MQNQRIAKIYDRQARYFDVGMGLGERLLLGRLRRRVLTEARGEVLEIGVGSGASLSYYPSGCKVTGLDLSSGMLGRARRRADKLGLDAVFFQGDAQRLPFEDAAFDTCVSQLSLCTVPEPLAALRELGRVCKPGGRILLMEHTTSLNPALGKVCRYFGPMLTRGAACHPNRPIVELVAQAGLRIERSERHVAGIFVLIWAAPP